jgi:hypothetical protein
MTCRTVETNRATGDTRAVPIQVAVQRATQGTNLGSAAAKQAILDGGLDVGGFRYEAEQCQPRSCS